MKATHKTDKGWCIITFPRGATITPQLFYRLSDNQFKKIGRVGSNDWVAVPHPSELELWDSIAKLITEDFNNGKYKKQLLKKRLSHG